MRERITPLRVVALIILLIGISIVSSYNDVKASANEMTSTIFEPINSITTFESIGSFNPEKYQQETFFKTGLFIKDWISFERDLTIGVSAIVAGLGLFIASTIADERAFWKNTIEFFT